MGAMCVCVCARVRACERVRACALDCANRERVDLGLWLVVAALMLLRVHPMSCGDEGRVRECENTG